MTKIALITGVTGQDGSLLTDFLLRKKYKVIGIKRRSSSFNTKRIDHIYDKKEFSKSFIAVYGDLTDSSNITRIIQKYKPDEIYNLGAQSFVGDSFDQPLLTSTVNGLGALSIFEAVKEFSPNSKVYQASSSEMYGNSNEIKNENSRMSPASPYGVSKVFAHKTAQHYREAYDMFISCGILFNHESPLRGPEFVTKKIISSLVRIKFKNDRPVELGNLNSYRDWGYVEDYVEAMFKIINCSKAEDFVIGTGNTTSIINFFKLACKEIGFDPVFKNDRKYKYCFDRKSKKKIMQINKKFFREKELHYLKARTNKANKILKWKPKTNLKQLIKIMVTYEIEKIKNPHDESFY